MAVDVSKIPNNNKFDPVREAILSLKAEIEDTGAAIGNGTLTIGTSGSLSGSGTFTANQTSNTIITIGIDDSDYVSLSETSLQTLSGSLSLVNITLSGYLRGPSTFVIDPATHGDDTGTLVIAGNLQVDGTTTTINSTTLTVDDKNIVIASGAANASAADGAGITIDGASATMTYNSTSDRFVFNKDIETNLVGDVTGGTISGTTGSFSGTLSLNASDALSFENGLHWITSNDGQQNFGIRVGHYSNASVVEECTEAGYIFQDEWSQSGGWREFNVSADSMTVGQLIGTDSNWRTQIEYDPSSVWLRYQGSTRLQTTSDGIDVTGNINLHSSKLYWNTDWDYLMFDDDSTDFTTNTNATLLTSRADVVFQGNANDGTSAGNFIFWQGSATSGSEVFVVEELGAGIDVASGSLKIGGTTTIDSSRNVYANDVTGNDINGTFGNFGDVFLTNSTGASISFRNSIGNTVDTDNLATISFQGYYDSAYVGASRIQVKANEDFSATARGSVINFDFWDTGSVFDTAVSIASDGLYIGTTNVYDYLPTGVTLDSTDLASNKLKLQVVTNGGDRGTAAFPSIVISDVLNEGFVPFIDTGDSGGDGASGGLSARLSDSWLKLTSDTLELGASDPISHEVRYARFLYQAGTNDKISTVYGAKDITASIQYLGGSTTAKIEFIGNTNIDGTVRFNGEYTFPPTDGTSGQVLGTNGSGDLSWVSGAATTSDLQVVTDNGNSTDNAIITTDQLAGKYLTLGNQELTLNPPAYSIWLDANDSNAPATIGDYAGSLPLGIYVNGDDGISTTTLGSGTVQVYHTGHFSGTHITNWQTAYTYSQVGHLPLSGGTLTGNLSVQGSVGVTNIVTNKVVKFNGTILDDSIITDNGSTVSVGGDLRIAQRMTMSEDGTYDVGISNGQGGQLWLETEDGSATAHQLARRFVITGNTATPYYYWYHGNSGSETVEMQFSTNANLLVYNKLAVGQTTEPTETFRAAGDARIDGSLNVFERIRIDRTLDEVAIVLEDSGGDDTGYLTMNDGQGNMSLMLGVDGVGNHIVTGDGAAKLLYSAHGQDGIISLNAGQTGTAGDAVSFSIGLSVNSNDNTIKVGASSDQYGLDNTDGNTIFNASGDLFTTEINARTGTEVLFNDTLRIDASGVPQLILDGGSDTTGDIVVPDGEILQVGHWNSGTSTYTDRFRIAADGNIGIQETTPSAALDIKDRVYIDTDATYGTTYGTVGFGGLQNGYARIFANTTNRNLYLNAGTGGDVRFRVNGVGTDVVEIYSDGNAYFANSVGIGQPSPSYKLDVSGNTRLDGLVGINANPDSSYQLNMQFDNTDANDDFHFAQRIDGNFSGIDNTTAIREQGGIYLDIDSSADGDASNEHRLYGIYNDVRFTGFSDIAQGIYTRLESNNSTEKTSAMYAVYAHAVHDSGVNGGVSQMIANFGVASVEDAGDVDNAYAGFFLTIAATTRTANVGNLIGTRSEVQIDAPTALTYGDVYGVQSVIDNNEDTLPSGTNSYLFYGEYQGTRYATNAYGLYVQGDKNYLEGSLGIGTDSPNAKLEVILGGEGVYFVAGGDDANNGRALEFSSSSATSNGALHTIRAKSGNGEIAFSTGTTEALRIDSSQNIGIGHDTPNVRLDVVHDINDTIATFSTLGDGGGSANRGLALKALSDGGEIATVGTSTNLQLNATQQFKVFTAGSQRLNISQSGLFNLNVGRGDVYFENNSNSNSDGRGITLRTTANPVNGSIFDVRSSGQASRLFVGQSITSAGINPFYVGAPTTGSEYDPTEYAIALNTNGTIDCTSISANNLIESVDFSVASNRFKIVLTTEDASTIEASLDDVVLSTQLDSGFVPYTTTAGGNGDTTNAILSNSFLKINSSTLELDWGNTPGVYTERNLKMRKDGGGFGTYYEATYAADSVSFLHYASASDIDTAKVGATSTGRIRINDTYSLPVGDGTNGQVLKTNGSGDLSWEDVGSFSTLLLGSATPSTQKGDLHIYNGTGAGEFYVHAQDSPYTTSEGVNESPSMRLHLDNGAGSGFEISMDNDCVDRDAGNNGFAFRITTQDGGFNTYGKADAIFNVAPRGHTYIGYGATRSGLTGDPMLAVNGSAKFNDYVGINTDIDSGSGGSALKVQGGSNGFKAFEFVGGAYASIGEFKFSYNGAGISVINDAGYNATGINFKYGTSSVGGIVINSTTTSYNTTSDYRLKENVAEITDGIDRLKQLKPSRFNFIGEEAVVDGFIAHEAQAVVPEAVSGEKDAVDYEGNPDYQGIDQSKLVPLLTAALQEAVAKIEALEQRIETLENQ